MNTCPTPEEVALFVGGDLDSIGDHLEQCASCQELVDELRSDASVLSVAPAVPQNAMERLLVAVPQRIAAKRRMKIWISAASAAAVFAVAWVGNSLLVPVAQMPREITSIEAPAIAKSPTAIVQQGLKKRRRPPAEERFRLVKTDASGEQLAVQVKTTDPNVVIILVGDLT